jgi:hypothetical protein
MNAIRTCLAPSALILFSCSVFAQTYEVPSELWDRPRTARAVAGEDGVKRAVMALLAQPEARLIIRHSTGQESGLQAEELKSWLGALAVDTRRIILRGDLPAGAAMQVEVQP